MPQNDGALGANGSQRRASFQRARSHETKRDLVQAAMAVGIPKSTAYTKIKELETFSSLRVNENRLLQAA